MIKSDRFSNGMKISIIVSFTALFFVTWSCGTDSPVEEEPAPEPTGEEVWNLLQQENYQNSWELWPGTTELYDGENAHMEPFLFTTYLNNIALDALMNGNDVFPDGSIIVKEAYAPEDSTFEAITSMYKVDGYNPDHNDWFWLMNSPDGMIGAEGRVQMCIDCHAGAANTDYVFQEQDFPGVTGEALWNQLQQEDYQNSWELWPGTEELYDGEDAHMEPFLFTTYLNNTALDALMNGSNILPDGSIIVKEAYAPEDSTFEAITTMHKVDGYNPDHNDWFWLMNSPDGMIGAQGRVDMCQSCHVQASNSDYIFQEFPN